MVGSSVNLAPLVYDLQRGSGLIEFAEAYKCVLKSVDVNPNIAESHVSCYTRGGTPIYSVLRSSLRPRSR